MASPLILFALFGSAFAAVPVSQEVVPVTVYFESYCPDSVKFLTKQLYPVFLSPLGTNLNVTLIPYGKATTTKTEGGDYTFTCHHGEKECRGNKVLACVLRDRDTTLLDQFKFINCTSSVIAANTKMEEYPVAQCALMSGIKADKVLSCSTDEMGSEFLAYFGNKTSELVPPLTSVPTVVFNEKYVEAENKLAVSDFRKALCSKLSGTKPAECLKSAAAPLQTAIFPVFAALVLLTRV